MAKKNIIEKTEDEKEILEESKEEEQPKAKRKKAYSVVLVGKSRIVYEVSARLGNSTTPDIWNGKLKVGDTIYLEEE